MPVLSHLGEALYRHLSADIDLRVVPGVPLPIRAMSEGGILARGTTFRVETLDGANNGDVAVVTFYRPLSAEEAETCPEKYQVRFVIGPTGNERRDEDMLIFLDVILRESEERAPDLPEALERNGAPPCTLVRVKGVERYIGRNSTEDDIRAALRSLVGTNRVRDGHYEFPP